MARLIEILPITTSSSTVWHASLSRPNHGFSETQTNVHLGGRVRADEVLLEWEARAHRRYSQLCCCRCAWRREMSRIHQPWMLSA